MTSDAGHMTGQPGAGRGAAMSICGKMKERGNANGPDLP